MFHHLFHDAPPWLFAALVVGLITHVGSGAVAILSGAGALAVRKGGRLHRRLGVVFVFAMLAMGAAASILAAVAVQQGNLSQVGNIFGGAFAVYLVTTGWLTVRRPAGSASLVDLAGAACAAVIAAVAAFWLLPVALGPEGPAQGVPVPAPIILAGVAALLAGLDLKVFLRGGVAGTPRIMRHLWRMCLGMFIATGSFFIGQQRDMPFFLQGSPILLALGFAPIVAMAFWLIRTGRGAARRPRPVLA